MIAGVSLRLLYLIFSQLLSSLTLLGRASASRDIELLVLRHEVVDQRSAVYRGSWQTPDVRCRCCQPLLSRGQCLGLFRGARESLDRRIWRRRRVP